MSRSVGERHVDDVATLVSRGLRDMAVITVPAALGYLVLAAAHLAAGPVQHGEFDGRDAVAIARALQAFALGLPFFSAFQLFTRTFYAMQDSRTPALVNVAAAVVNVAANLFFLNVAGWGVVGLALGHATSYVFSSAVCLILLRRRLRGIEAASIVGTLSRVVPAASSPRSPRSGWPSCSNAPSVWPPCRCRSCRWGPPFSTGLLVFAASAFIFGIQEVDEVRGAVLRRFRR